MDYEKAYKEAIKRAKAIIEVAEKEEEVYKSAITIFPELCESEDEQIRKWIIDDIRYNMNNEPLNNSEYKKKAEKAIAWLEKQGQKPILDFKAKDWYVSKVDGKIRNIYHSVDKVEPKFNVGDWVADNNGKVAIIYDLQKTGYVGHYTDGTDFICKYSNEYLYHLWTIQDAKDGDVLYSHEHNLLWIYKNKEECHAAINLNYTNSISFGTDIVIPSDICPATKSQRDTLLKAMAEAGYEWDDEKKELKKIDDEEVNGEDYGIDSLYHAQRILEKTLGSVDGYQTDDGILDHKAAITAVKKLYEQKSIKWSEEDECNLKCWIAKANYDLQRGNIGRNHELIDWLKSLKDRVKPKQKWSLEDERVIAIINNALTESNTPPDDYDKVYDWLESLKQRIGG